MVKTNKTPQRGQKQIKKERPRRSFSLVFGDNKKRQPFGCLSLCRHYLSSRPVSRQVFSAQVNFTTVFDMGTGGPSL